MGHTKCSAKTLSFFISTQKGPEYESKHEKVFLKILSVHLKKLKSALVEYRASLWRAAENPSGAADDVIHTRAKRELTDNSPQNTNHLLHLRGFNRELCF